MTEVVAAVIEPTTPANPVTPPKTEVPAPVTFTPEQQAELDRLIGKARTEGKSAAERSAQEAKDAADAAKAITDQEAKGQYEAAKQSLEGERDTAKTDAATLKTQIDAANVVIAEQVESLKGDLPKELLTDYPADVTPLDQLVWLKREAARFEVAKAAAGVTTTNVTRLVATPAAVGQASGVTKEQQAAIDRQYRVGF